MKTNRTADRKITVHVPEELLRDAQKQTGQGITETIRQGLKLVAAGETFRKLRDLRGKVTIKIDLDSLREDRRW
jgi:Arc/MetJ-type ribon-helix-helix transcriptional regulator